MTYDQLLVSLIKLCTEAQKDLANTEIYGAVASLEVFARVKLVQEMSAAGKEALQKKVKK